MKNVLNANFKFFLYIGIQHIQGDSQILAIYMPHFDTTFLTLPRGVRTSLFLQDVRHDLLYMTIFDLELYSSCTTLQVA